MTINFSVTPLIFQLREHNIVLNFFAYSVKDKLCEKNWDVGISKDMHAHSGYAPVLFYQLPYAYASIIMS